MLELVDNTDSKSVAEMRVSSSLTGSTIELSTLLSNAILGFEEASTTDAGTVKVVAQNITGKVLLKRCEKASRYLTAT